MTEPIGPVSRLWRVDITSFVGSLAYGATHTYGVLVAPDQVIMHNGEPHYIKGQKYALQRVLSERGAAELNKVNERFGRDHAIDYEAGDITQQWDNQEQVEHAAILAWPVALGPEGPPDPQSVLIVAHDDINPGKPLDGPGTLCRTLNDIYERDEAAGWDYGPEREECFAEWQRAVEPLKYERAPAKRIMGHGAPPEPRDVDIHVNLDTKTVTMEGRW